MACTSCTEARKSQAIAQAAYSHTATIALDAAIETTAQLLSSLRIQRREFTAALLQQPLPITPLRRA